MGDEEDCLGQQVTGADTVHQLNCNFSLPCKESRQRDPDKPGIAQPGEEEHDGIPGRSVQALQGSEKLQFSVHKGSFFMSSLFLGWTVSSIPFVALTERQAPPPFGRPERVLCNLS